MTMNILAIDYGPNTNNNIKNEKTDFVKLVPQSSIESSML